MTEQPLTAFQRKLAERRAREAAAKVLTTPPPSDETYADLIPDDVYDRSDTDREMDAAIAGIDILTAYGRWCGKMTPKVSKGQRESIMISCPIPSHLDKVPSAWINLDKQTWFCGGCGIGGDVHDIAAYHFGYPVPAYKSDGRFHELRGKMASDFGYTIVHLPGGVSYLNSPVDDDEPEVSPTPEAPAVETIRPVELPEPSSKTPVSTPALVVVAPEPESSLDDEPEADVIELYEVEGEIVFPKLDWQKVCPKDSFLDRYMTATTVDDVTEEYHFFNALVALGFALGRQARLFDMLPVYSNLFICTLGHSGSGKSKARGHLDRLLTSALPHDWTDPSSRGVRKIGTPGSAEVLIHDFQKPIADPANPKVTMYFAPVSGVVDFSELSALVGRTNRMGSVLKPTLMQFYDMETIISTSSMSTGAKEAHEPFASAITSTQPLALKSLLGRSDDDSGFLNRWVFVAGPEKKRLAIGGVRVDMEPAVEPLRRVLAWSGTFGDDEYIQWSADGAELFTKFFHEVIEPAKRTAETALLTRIDLLMKKLVLLFAANRFERTASRQSVADAISCYEYLVQCYAIPEAQIGNTFQQEISDAIMYQARKQYELDRRGVTMNQIALALKRRKYPHDMLLKVCDSLVKLGFLDLETSMPGVRGRPTVRYTYVNAK